MTNYKLPQANSSTFESDISKKLLEVLLEQFGRERLRIFWLEPEYLITAFAENVRGHDAPIAVIFHV